MYYGDMVADNDEARFRQARACGQAARASRFRHVESREGRSLKAVGAWVHRFLRERLRRREAVTRPARESLSYQ